MKLGVVLLNALAICTPLFADVSVPVMADTSVSVSNPSLTGGSLTLLPVSADRVALLKFDIAAAVPPGTLASGIAKATLRLYVNHMATAGSFDVHPAAGDWNEGAATSANAVPDLSLHSTFNVTRDQEFVFADVSEMMQRWLTTPALNHGLTIRASAAGQLTSAYFDSKESVSTSHPAEIEIMIAKPAGPPGLGLQGVQGATGPRGPTGPNGMSLMPWVSTAKGCALGLCTVVVACPVPEAIVLSGGCGQVSGDPNALNVMSSGPSADFKSWVCQVVNIVKPFGAVASFEGFARCIR